MIYTKDTIIGDVTTYESYEGTPEEILQLINGMPQELKGGEVEEGFNIGKDLSVEINSERISEVTGKVSRELVDGMNKSLQN